jgi:hypothetical protein
MSRLFDIINFNARETVASYCSRLAAACGYRHARSFGADLGFRFQGLAVGNEDDVKKFASVVGVPACYLSDGIVTTRDRMSTIAGHEFSKTLVERQRLRFCPFCIREDEEQLGGRRGFRSYGRISWLIAPIRTCQRHGVRLVTSAHSPESSFLHDFAANLAVESEHMDRLLSSAERWAADSLQTYVEARLANTETGADWLGTLPLYVAIRLCEMVGASVRHGTRFQMAAINQQEWSACAGTGYDLLCGGEDQFRAFLATQLERFHNGKGPPGGRALYGRMYEWLAHETSDPNYNPIREIMRDVALDNLPLGPGDEMFGSVTERRLHSVWSASVKFEVHVERLRKLVVNTGLVPPDHVDRTPDRILLPVEAMEELIGTIRNSLEVKEASALLGIKCRQFETLYKNGVLTPHGGDRLTAPASHYPRFVQSDLHKFIDRLKAVVTCDENPELTDLLSASKKVNRRYDEIVALVLSGALSTVAWAADQAGLDAVRIDPIEIRDRLSQRGHDCYTYRDLERLVPAPYKVVQALVADGHLTAVTRRSSLKRTYQTVVEPEVFAAFRMEFVPLANLAGIRGTTSKKLELRLKEAAIEPVFTSGEMHFYRRVEVLHLFP